MGLRCSLLPMGLFGCGKYVVVCYSIVLSSGAVQPTGTPVICPSVL
jgi:hypothetical protein